jgi:XTP/dITP diphosphohydrolase
MKAKCRGTGKSLELVVATRNKKKLKEIRELLKGLDINIVSLAGFPKVPKVKEDGTSFVENAIKKATAIARFTGRLTLGEDSGLEVKALNGAPGIYSSRFARQGDDKRNNEKLLESLEGLPLSRRQARYRCAVAIADRGGLIDVTTGTCSGVIGFRPRGHYGFGYDPLFIIPKYKKTFAQLGPRIKHKMSHRYRALKEAKRIIQKYIEKERKGLV